MGGSLENNQAGGSSRVGRESSHVGRESSGVGRESVTRQDDLGSTRQIIHQGAARRAGVAPLQRMHQPVVVNGRGRLGDAPRSAAAAA